MKKIFLAVTTAALLTSAAQADFVRVEMGVGGWQSKPDNTNTATYATNGLVSGTYTTNAKSKSDMYAWMFIKHPIPIVPNVRLEYTSIEDKGSASGTFEDFNTPGAPSTIKMKQYDAILYYNLLDNLMWTTVDLGLDAKILDTTVEAQGVNIYGVGTGNYTKSKTIGVPLVYARARVQVPATGLGFEGDLKYVTYSGSTVTDARIKADYTFDLDVIKPGIEIGYRYQNFDLESSDKKTKVKLKYSGVYAGLMVRF